jgi:dTDP-4-dehydrorhamnose reductase
MTDRMKILCIGKSGQVAQALAERTAFAGVDCVCLGRPELDLLSVENIEAAFGDTHPTIVVNAAAYTNVDGAESDQATAFAVNADAVGQLAEHCANRGLPLVHLSTDYVFDGSGAEPFLETDPTDPLNTYGASKLAGEMAIREALSQHVILRTAWVYSSFGRNFVKTMLRLGEEQGEATVVDDQIGAPTSALDIADTILLIARQIEAGSEPEKCGTYHYAASGEASWADVAALIFEIYEKRHGCKIKLKRIPSSDYATPARRPLNSRLNTNKITETFGVVPKDWKLSLEATVERLLQERAETR